MYVRDLESGEYLDTIVVGSIEDAEFDVESHVVEPGISYIVDFYADHNGNGGYDAPPTDHAWRLETGQAMGDVELDFIHNTDFTEIFATTSIGSTNFEPVISIYPNPAGDYINIEAEKEIASVILHDVRGSRVRSLENLQSSLVNLSLEGIHPGIYLLKINSVNHQTKTIRMIKQ